VSLRSLSEARHNFSAPTFSATAATPFVMVAPIPGFRICVYRLIVTVGVATIFYLQDTYSTPNYMTGGFNLGATGGVSLDVPFNYDPWWYTGQVFLNFAGGAASAQQGGNTPPTNPLPVQYGQGLGVNGVMIAGGAMSWDIWWDAHP
jgi:hypothetical protein